MSENGFEKKASGRRAFTLPSFFLVGPPRTGTTWLHTVLNERAWLSYPTKETRFFDKHFNRGLSWYASHYRKPQAGRVIGEVAPTYFASEQARERIARLVPNARIICTLRNPVDRLLSLYRLKRAYGLVRWTFEEALKRDPEMMESSRYCAHLKGWKITFGDAQVMVALHEDIKADPQSYLDEVADFITMPRFKLLPCQIQRVLSSDEMTEPRNYYWTRGANLLAEWSKAQRLDAVVALAKRMGMVKVFVGGGRHFADLSICERVRLRELFRPEVEQLETMLNRDLSIWREDGCSVT
jgi:Sulfotransferase domain